MSSFAAGLHTGYTKGSAKRQGTKSPQKEKPRTAGNDSGFRSVRGRGLEPLWLLTASTSTRNDAPDSNDLAELRRQETSESVPKRPILATCSQNSEPADLVADRLRDAWRAWAETHEPRELRKVLLAILGLLDG
jgi:hypothetical protein